MASCVMSASQSDRILASSGLTPEEADIVDSIPPSYFGGNIDNWRIGKGTTMHYPVAVEGGLLSLGDSNAAQGDSELAGIAIEMSLTGVIQVVVHDAESLPGTDLEDLRSFMASAMLTT